jgi:hypothetical protein
MLILYSVWLRLSHIGYRAALYLLFIVGGYKCYAQNVTFTVQASATTMQLNDRLQVSYTIVNAQSLRSLGPADKGFSDFILVAGPYQSQTTSVSIINGVVVQLQSFTVVYILKPRHPGILTVPEGVAKDAIGHCYHSNKLAVAVIGDSTSTYKIRRHKYF